MPEQPSDSQPTTSAHDPPDLTTMDLDDAVRRRASPRRRALQIGSVALLLVMLLGVVVYELTRTLPAPPVAASPPTVLVSNVSFGTVTLNGNLLSGSPPIVLPLQSGVNHIILSALPFAAQSCQLTWSDGALANIGDCPAEGRDTSISIGGRSIRPGLVIALTMSGDDLPETLATSAQTTIAGALTEALLDPVALAPGESIATGGFYPAQVNTSITNISLQASVVFTLPEVVQGLPFAPACPEDAVLCAGAPLVNSSSGGAEWMVTLDAAYHWVYTDARGQVVATSMDYPLVPPAGMLLEYYSGSPTGWHILAAPSISTFADPQFGTWAGKLCGAGAGILEANTLAQQGTATVLQDRGVEGCELLLHTSDGLAHRFIWRCGVLLADGALASQLVPDVPVALPAVAAAFSG